jgi:N-dimethylarginine dimethylaminohydrolase
MVANEIRTSPLIDKLAQVKNFDLTAVAFRQQPTGVLMCDPDMEHYVGATNKGLASKQWQALKSTIEDLGYSVKVVKSEPDREDMVFTANQVLTGLDDQNKPYALLSEMKHPSRRLEVPIFANWFRSHGYQIIELASHTKKIPLFEGQGDALWHPGKKLLWAGFGFRSEEEAPALLNKILKVPVIKMQLVKERFYHLDTCFAPLDGETVLFYPDALADEGVELIKHFFPKQIVATTEEANNFACNAVVLGRNVVLQSGSERICKELKKYNFKPVEVDTSEFMKSGGSAFCMSMMIY